MSDERQRLGEEELARMEACAPLLPEPGGEVLLGVIAHYRSLLDEKQDMGPGLSQRRGDDGGSVTTRVSREEFRAILDWFMCSDPWPVCKGQCSVEAGGTYIGPPSCDVDNHETIEAWMGRMAKAFGYDNWVEAFHEAD